MSSDVLNVIGLVFAGLGVAVAAASGALGAIFGYRAVAAGRQAVAEARTARREAHLYRELDRLVVLAGLLKRMWAIANRIARKGTPAVPGAGDDMDVLLYEFRAMLVMLGRDELTQCRHLVDSFDGPRLLGNGRAIQEAEDEVVAAITGCRRELKGVE